MIRYNDIFPYTDFLPDHLKKMARMFSWIISIITPIFIVVVETPIFIVGVFIIIMRHL